MQSQTGKINELAVKYFEAWNNHDLGALSEISSEEVTLRDWEISVSGKSDFLKANSKIFKNNPGIKAELKGFFINGNEIVAILDISSHASDDIHPVVDHIKFENNKIASITAYRGF